MFPFIPTTVAPNGFDLNIFYQDNSTYNLTGPWTMTFTNAATTPSTVVVTTPFSLEGVAAAPFANNTTISGAGLNPTFTWSYPTSVHGVEVRIIDKCLPVYSNGVIIHTCLPPPHTISNADFTGYDVVFAHTLPGATNSYTLPTVLEGGYTLTAGENYVVMLKAIILRDPAGPLTGANTEAASQTFFDFTPPFPPLRRWYICQRSI